MSERRDSSLEPRHSADCDDCTIRHAIERREFLRSAVVALTAIGITAASASAMPVAFVTGEGEHEDKAYPIPAADGVSIDKKESVIIARTENKVFAFSLACPHQNTALRWLASLNRFQCPKHESKYRPDGVFIDGRATRGMDRFAVKRDGDKVVVNLDTLYEEDKNAEWKAAFIEL